MTRTHYLILAAFALSFLAGCATTRTGNETAGLQAHAAAAQASVQSARSDFKEARRAVHGASLDVSKDSRRADLILRWLERHP